MHYIHCIYLKKNFFQKIGTNRIHLFYTIYQLKKKNFEKISAEVLKIDSRDNVFLLLLYKHLYGYSI